MTTFLLRASIPLLGFWLVGACATEAEYIDEGMACVMGEEGQPHDVSVDFGVCLSSSCDELEEASCTAALEGTTITVEAMARVSTKGNACTDDCRRAMASCQTPPLAAGTYTVVYGEFSAELTVPATMGTCTAEFM